MLELNEINNPFPGIRPFEMVETNLFFGRDGQSDELLKRMQRSHLLAVVGTSGSGKSSLIRAGLLPALYGGLMGDAGSSWRIAIQRPGGDPIGNLALALADPLVFGSESDAEIQTALIETTLRRSSIGLIDVARQARMSAHENLLVVVDQFEELFRFKQAHSGDDATAFVKLLLEASAQKEIPIYIIITMRSDFLGDCSQFTGLPEAINDGQYLIPRMSRDERQAAIVGPIAVGSGEISAPLVSRLLNDVGDSPDQLPILQHALMRTWDYWAGHRRNGKPIDLEDYTAIGTMAEALSRHADEAFNELSDERSRLIAEKLCKRLTERGTDNREIRRPTPVAELCAVCAASEEELIAIIDVFRREGRSFLMPPAGTKLTRETVIDISHESLIRNWVRLQKWVDEEAQSSRIYRRLAEAAVLHREGSEGLLQDPALQIALDWFEKNNPNAAWAQRYHPEFEEAKKYLAESCEAREAAEQERERQRNAELDRERREREQAEIYAAGQARTARRLRRFTFALVLISLLAILAAGASVFAFTRARKSQTEALVSQSQAVTAQKKAEQLAAELKDNYANLQQEKAKADQFAADLRIESDKTKKALKAEQEAVAKQSQALLAQRKATNAAEENLGVAAAARNRGAFIRGGLEASRRGEYDDAAAFFYALIENLEEAIKLAEKKPSDNYFFLKSLKFDLGWAYLHYGKQQGNMGHADEAKQYIENALGRLTSVMKFDERILATAPKGRLDKDVLEALEPGATQTLFEAYEGLGHAYYDQAKEPKMEIAARTPLLTKAEEFYRKALYYQTLLISTESDEAADVNQNLGRIHTDQGEFAEAEKNFKRAIEIYSIELSKRPNEASEANKTRATKQLAEFYRAQGRYDDAAATYLNLADLQENSSSDETKREIVDTYSDLGQVYSAMRDDDRATIMFQLAEKLQQFFLKSKQNNGATTPESERLFEALGDAYLRAGSFLPSAFDLADDAYQNALHVSQLNDTLAGRRWAIYERLAYLHLNGHKDYSKAEEYFEDVVELLKDQPNDHSVDALNQLAAIYGNQLKQPGEAVARYELALAIKTQSNWARYRTLTGLAELYRKQNDTANLNATYKTRLEVAESLLKEKSPNTVAQKAFNQRDYADAVKLYINAVTDLTGISSGSGDALEAYHLLTTNPQLSINALVDVATLEMYAHTLETCLGLASKISFSSNPKPVIFTEAPALIKRARDRMGEINVIRQEAEQSQQTQQRRAP